MKRDEELVERVAQAMAKWSDYSAPTHRHQRYAEVAVDALAPELRHDPPEGCEWVALPTEDVDRWCEGWATLVDAPSERAGSIGVLGQVVDACHGAVARRPKPEPRTEWVPAIQALGREVVSDEGSRSPTFVGSSIVRWVYDGLAVQSYSGRSQQRIAPDGTVEVLAEDGAE